MTCIDYKPDHNGECLNCDEPLEAHYISILRNLLSRDADCRCGNMRLTRKELEAIQWVIGDDETVGD